MYDNLLSERVSGGSKDGDGRMDGWMDGTVAYMQVTCHLLPK